MLRRATPYELGWTSFYLPSYVRGLLYLQARDAANARVQFKNILDHQGVLTVSPLYSLSHLQMARAAALSRDTLGAKQGYEQFLSMWKDADTGQPLLSRARAEYQQLLRGATP
jgi:eukaryotic-like serine/threonine-protein kinase